MNGKQIEIYRHTYISTLEEFKKQHKEEKEKGTLKRSYIVVYYYNDEMKKFNDINKAIDYVKEDYKNNKEEFYLELSAYNISAIIETIAKEYEGIRYEYSYNMDLLGLGGVC